MTQSEIAERVGVSQMQISRLLRRALRTLREEAEAEAQVEARVAVPAA
jgi:RNA polymerase sigma-B factor